MQRRLFTNADGELLIIPQQGAIELQRSGDGHFYADVQINGTQRNIFQIDVDQVKLASLGLTVADALRHTRGERRDPGGLALAGASAAGLAFLVHQSRRAVSDAEQAGDRSLLAKGLVALGEALDALSRVGTEPRRIVFAVILVTFLAGVRGAVQVHTERADRLEVVLQDALTLTDLPGPPPTAFVTPVPKTTLDVRAAAAAITVVDSRQMFCESPNHTLS